MSAQDTTAASQATNTSAIPTYAFLAAPPASGPKQYKRPGPAPVQPLPSPPVQRRRSSTFNAISSWAAHVHPGSPAPCTPPGRRRPSVSRRRPSISLSPGRSSSFLNFLDTPTTGSTKDFNKADLIAQGYLSVFVPLQTPRSATPAPASPQKPGSPNTPPQRRALRPLRPFAQLKQRARSASRPRRAMPSLSPPTPKTAKPAAAIAKHNRAKYAHLRPPPLANELALMQFESGGRIENHARRAMAAQAKAAGHPHAVGAAHRDANGTLWWDADEEWEYAHLLGGREGQPKEGWVDFANSEGRRGSASTQGSGSDMESRAPVQPTSADDRADDMAAFRVPASSVLSLPARPRTKNRHLPLPGYFPSAPSVAQQQQKRRPPPLQLAPPSPADQRPSNTPDARDAFMAGSFAPAPAPTSAPLSKDKRRGRSGSVAVIPVIARKVSKFGTLLGGNRRDANVDWHMV